MVKFENHIKIINMSKSSMMSCVSIADCNRTIISWFGRMTFDHDPRSELQSIGMLI